jgi:hypothetical protein
VLSELVEGREDGGGTAETFVEKVGEEEISSWSGIFC